MTKLPAVVLVCATLLAGAFLPAYRIEKIDNYAQLFWNSDEAHLFITTTTLGFRHSYGATVLFLLFARLGVASHDQVPSIHVVRITPANVEHYHFENRRTSLFRIIDDRIVSSHWRWDRDTFRPNTAHESQQWLSPRQPGDYSNVDGWSMRVLLPRSGEMSVPLDVGLRRSVLIVNAQRKKTIIDLSDRPGAGRRSERLWTLEKRARWMSKTEYDGLFSSLRK